MIDVVAALIVVLEEVVSSLGVSQLGGELARRWRRKSIESGRRVMTRGGLRRLRNSEFASLPDGEWHAALQAVRDTFKRASYDPERVFRDGLLPEVLRNHLSPTADPVLGAAGLSDGALEAYRRLVDGCCERIVDLLRADPDFMTWVQSVTLSRVSEIHDQSSRERQALDAEDRDFEYRFRDSVVSTPEFQGVELFGVTDGRPPRRHSFRSAYVSLAVARANQARDQGGEARDLTGAGSETSHAFDGLRLVMLRGGAGAGKTTLLHWLAATAASAWPDGAGDPWQEGVPFVVRLREFEHRDLPRPSELPALMGAAMLAEEMPDRWVHRQFNTGRGLLLVDAVDELPPARRRRVREWLGEFVRSYPEGRVLVTSRPAAVPEGWLDELGFAAFDLLPMSEHGVDTFLDKWHSARAEYEQDDRGRAWVADCNNLLKAALAGRAELRALASSPLLCGLICLLNLRGGAYLPRDRKGLYDTALDLLLVRWDEQRRIRPDLLLLSREEQVVLLQRLAFTLVTNGEMQITRDEAVKRIAHAMQGLRSERPEPEQVVQRMLERTGLLRAVKPDRVEFVHRTFRDYLAAKEVIDSGQIPSLIANAHRDQWRDVVLMAMAHAHHVERDQLLDGLLDGNEASRQSNALRDRLHLLAAACLYGTDVVRTDQTRERVTAATSRLVPPDCPADADLLAKAGPFVLDLLPGPDGLSKAQQAAVVRTAALISHPRSVEVIRRFVAVAEFGVIDELLRAWRAAGDVEEYARMILASVEFGSLRVEIRGWHRIKHLRHLGQLRHLCCLGDFRSLDSVADMPALHRLELMQNEQLTTLTPLSRCRTLRTLEISQYPELTDLSELARGTVEDLSLHFVRADLGSLQGAPVKRLRIRDRRLADGLHALPADLPLVELTLDDRADSRNLTGLERWPSLTHLTLAAPLSPAELHQLRDLPQLTTLRISRADPTHLDVVRAALPRVNVRA